MQSRWRFSVLVGLLFLSNFIAAASNWPNWRGPNSNGATLETNAVLAWDRTNNVRWRLELPERGNSSPIVWQNRVFLTQAVGKRRTLIAVDRDTGTIAWQAGPTYELPETTYMENNPYCAASPVTDGQRVIAFFGSAGIYCYDFKGKEIWRTQLGQIEHVFGTASSPILSGNFCYAYVGPDTNETMVALNKRNGKVVWRNEGLRPRPEDLKRVSTNGPPYGSWSTPLMITNKGRNELVMSLAFRFGGFDAKTGKLLWERDGLGLQTYVTPLWTDNMVVAMSGVSAIAVRPPEKKDEKLETVWEEKKMKFRFSSGVERGDYLYYISENGFAECWEKQTGKPIWQERLQGPGKKMTSWSSVSMAGDKIYAPNQSGDVFVFAAEPTFKMISTNSVAEPTNASLAISDGRVFMRTDNALWCFGS